MSVVTRLGSAVLMTIGAAAMAFAQCPVSGGGGAATTSGSSGSALSSVASPAASSTAGNSARGTARRSSVVGFGELPQLCNPFPTGMTSLQAFQAQQALAQRLTAESAVRNRRSAARQQQMLEINAEKAYRAALSAEKAGRHYTALRRYERAAQVAPGSLAAQYAEDAIDRLSE